jgi:hypothetical protein
MPESSGVQFRVPARTTIQNIPEEVRPFVADGRDRNRPVTWDPTAPWCQRGLNDIWEGVEAGREWEGPGDRDQFLSHHNRAGPVVSYPHNIYQ